MILEHHETLIWESEMKRVDAALLLNSSISKRFDEILMIVMYGSSAKVPL